MTASQITAAPVDLPGIAGWRERFRREMNCQIIHDSLHVRPGWTESFLLSNAGMPIGYGAQAIAGPWTGTRTLFEFFLAPDSRHLAFHAFEALLSASRATAMEVQSNEVLTAAMLLAYGHNVRSEKILFADGLTTRHTLPGVTLVRRESSSDWALEDNGQIVASGGILYHYNRPYGDIYMEVAEPFRRRGYGAYLVQELKRICHASGSIPGARCNTENLASRATLQKAGFVPCGHILLAHL